MKKTNNFQTDIFITNVDIRNSTPGVYFCASGETRLKYSMLCENYALTAGELGKWGESVWVRQRREDYSDPPLTVHNTYFYKQNKIQPEESSMMTATSVYRRYGWLFFKSSYRLDAVFFLRPMTPVYTDCGLMIQYLFIH